MWERETLAALQLRVVQIMPDVVGGCRPAVTIVAREGGGVGIGLFHEGVNAVSEADLEARKIDEVLHRMHRERGPGPRCCLA